jgi:hypothetical protein
VLSACRATIQTTQTVNPSSQKSAYEKPYAIYQGLYGALKDVFQTL